MSTEALLKEGTQHLSGVAESLLRNVEACTKLSDITSTSLGPNGRNKIIIDQHEKLNVTSDSSLILQELEVVHPAAQLLVLAAKTQEKEVGDGTNLVITLGGELLNQAASLIRMGLHPADLIAGYQTATKFALEELEELIVETLDDVRDVNKVARYLRSVIAAKQYGYEDLLAPIVAEACIQILDEQNLTKFNVDNVRTVKVLGGGISDTKLLKGFAMARDAEGTVKHVTKAKIAVFAGGLDLTKTETKGTVLIQNAEDLTNFSRGEEDEMSQLIDEVCDAGVNVVVSGGNVGEMALHFLERRKVMVLKVQSKFQLRRICRAVGATPLVRLGKPVPEELGECERVSIDEVGSTKVCLFEQAEHETGISTIIVRASTQNILDDIERAIDHGVNTFKTLCRDPCIVAGAGACELALAARLEKIGSQTPGLDQYAIRKFGEAFEMIPRRLAENAGMNENEAVSNLYAARENGVKNAGLNVDEQEVADAVELGIFDSRLTKYWAVKLASEAVVTILSVDTIIMARRAGGPRLPQQGPRDG